MKRGGTRRRVRARKYTKSLGKAGKILNGVSDVVVTDGFTGNMILKTIEGTAGAMFTMLKDAFTANVKSKVAYVLVKDGLKNIKNTLDYSEYGGAALFGLKAPVIKAHGSSNGRAIFSAIRQAHLMVEHDVSVFLISGAKKRHFQE